jgi:rhodanese-related sulfurtransferase
MKKISISQFAGKLVSTTLCVFFVICIVNCSSRNEEDAILSIEKVNEIISDSSKVQEYIILDMRSRMDYVRGHLVSSIWMNLDSLKIKMDMIPKEKKIILYDSEGIESLKAAILLQKNGFTNFYVMHGGFDKWIKKGYPAAIQLVMNTNDKLDIEKKDITTDEVYQIIKNNSDRYSIIDIRSRLAFKDGHVENSISIPYVPLNEFVVGVEEQNFPKNKSLIIYCDNDSHDIGEKAVEVLVRNDYTQVYLMQNGLDEWISKQYPIFND